MITKNKNDKDKPEYKRNISPKLTKDNRTNQQIVSPKLKAPAIPIEKAIRVLDKQVNISNYRLSSLKRSQSRKSINKSVDKRDVYNKYSMYQRDIQKKKELYEIPIKSSKDMNPTANNDSAILAEKKEIEEKWNYLSFFELSPRPKTERKEEPNPKGKLDNFILRINSSPAIEKISYAGFKTPQNSYSVKKINLSKSINPNNKSLEMAPYYSRTPSVPKYQNNASDYYLHGSITDIRDKENQSNHGSPFKKMIYDLINSSKKMNSEREKEISKSFDKNTSINIEKSRKILKEPRKESLSKFETQARSASRNNSKEPTSRGSPAKSASSQRTYNIEDIDSETKYVLECLRDVQKKLADPNEKDKKKIELKAILLMELVVNNCLKMSDANINTAPAANIQLSNSQQNFKLLRSSQNSMSIKPADENTDNKGSIKAKIDTMKQIEAKLKDLNSKRTNLRERRNIIMSKNKF